MKKTTAIIWLFVLSVFGPFITFYVTNLVLSDVSNMFYGVHDVNFISSIPGFLFAFDVILATLWVTRRYTKPQNRKHMTLLYSTLLAVFSLIGVIGAVLTGTLIYRSFTAPYPFPGYTLLTLIIHAALLVFACVSHYRSRCNMPEDIAPTPTKPGYVVYTVFLVALMFLAYDRYGAFLWMPFYVHIRTLYLTFPFYLSLMLPMGLLAHIVFYVFKVYERLPNSGIINILIILAMDLILGIAVFTIGARNPQFISAVSPALAIERLMTLPIDTVCQFVLVLIFGIYFLIYSLRFKKRHPQHTIRGGSADAK